MSAVQDVIRVLGEAGVLAEWHNTGGGCMAIRIPFGVSESHPYGVSEILITDREDVFTAPDYDSDEGVWGFFARAYKLDAEGIADDEDDSEGWLFCTPDDAGVAASETEFLGAPAVDLSLEVREVCAAILGYVADGHIKSIQLPAQMMMFQCGGCDAEMLIPVTVWRDKSVHVVPHVGCEFGGGADLDHARRHGDE